MKPLLLAALLLLAAAPAFAQDDDTVAIDDMPRITIVGTAATEVAPDLATITVGVTGHRPTAVAVTNAVSKSAQAVIDAAKAQNVKDADIATQSTYLSQSFDDLHDPQGRVTGRRPTGFDAANTISIRIRDLAKAGELAQSLVDKGANSLDGIEFSVEHPQPILDKLAAEAVANARRQADLVAQAAGVKLGRVLLIARPGELPVRRAPPVFAPMARAETAAPRAIPVQAGTTSFEVEMRVTWAIER